MPRICRRRGDTPEGLGRGLSCALVAASIYKVFLRWRGDAAVRGGSAAVTGPAALRTACNGCAAGEKREQKRRNVVFWCSLFVVLFCFFLFCFVYFGFNSFTYIFFIFLKLNKRSPFSLLAAVLFLAADQSLCSLRFRWCRRSPGAPAGRGGPCAGRRHRPRPPLPR